MRQTHTQLLDGSQIQRTSLVFWPTLLRMVPGVSTSLQSHHPQVITFGTTVIHVEEILEMSVNKNRMITLLTFRFRKYYIIKYS